MPNLSTQIQNVARDWMNETMRQPGSSFVDRCKHTVALKLLTRLVGQAIPFSTRNGFEVVDYQPGYIKTRIPLKSNTNHFNAMYAGALYTVAELPGGILSLLTFDDDYYPTLAEMTVRYVRPAKTDVTVEFSLSQQELERIQGEAKAEGKSRFSLEGELKDAEGEIVAYSTAHYQVRHKAA